MKNKLYLVFTILISILMINIAKAESLLTYDKTYNYNMHIENLRNAITLNDKLYLLNENASETTIINPDDTFENNISKSFPDLTNASIIKYNTNLMLVGISKNTLKVYLLDENLQIQNQKETSFLIDLDATIKTYYYENKIYLMLFEDESMLTNNIYEIDENLNITENGLSSYDSELIKKVLKGDYYIIRMNDIEENNRIIHYNDTAYTKDYSILVGNSFNITYDETNGYEEKAHLAIIDSSGNKTLDIDHIEYTNYKDVEIINEKIIILATNQAEEYILIYNKNAVLEDSIKLETTYNSLSTIAKNIYKLNNRLVVHSIQTEINQENQLIQNFSFYKFDLSITTNESPYGTIEVINTAKSNTEVEMKIIPNAGFEVDTIEIIDTLGNKIPVLENKYIMPEEDVYITVNYKASVTNPETNDLIFNVTIATIFGIAIIFLLFKRLRWLK